MRQHRLGVTLTTALLVLVATTWGCDGDDDLVPTNIEGDSPGECSDGADNDSDGRYDCDDPDCWTDPDCTGADDEEGQQLTSTFMDYLIPTINEVPMTEKAALVTPSPFSPLGAKGVGEGAIHATPAAMMAAINDALQPFGVRATEVPAAPKTRRRKPRWMLLSVRVSASRGCA